MRAASARGLRRKRGADLQLDPELLRKTPRRLLDPRDAPRRIEADEPRPDIDGGQIDHAALAADRNLRGAAADVDIHDRGAVADRARHRARPIGRHHGLQIVAGRDRDHLAGLRREQLADLARVAAAHRDAGQDQRAGVDLLRVDLGVHVLALDESAERRGVDLLLRGIGRE